MIPNLTGNLSSLLNIVPTPGALTILPIKMVGPIPMPDAPPYVVMFNPEQFSESTTINYRCEPVAGNPGTTELKFEYVSQPQIRFEFLIDGTGASGDKREVLAEIELFKLSTGFNGDKHEPNDLVLIWGTFIFQGRLKTMDIQYTLFRANGIPLRAKIGATFAYSVPNLIGKLTNPLFSPDLTRKHTVRAGDRLDNISTRYFDDTRHHVNLALANNLTTIRRLDEGETLNIPPLEK